MIEDDFTRKVVMWTIITLVIANIGMVIGYILAERINWSKSDGKHRTNSSQQSIHS